MRHALLALLVVAGCGGDSRSDIGIDGGAGGDDGTGDDGTGDDGTGDDGTGDDGTGDDVAEYVSGTRIRRRMGATPDGAKMFLGWRDTMLNIDCGFSRAADGLQRCLPTTAATASTLFSDAGCSMELAAVYCVGAAAPRYTLKPITTTCGELGRSSVHSTGAAYPGAIFFKSGEQCAPYPGARPPYSFFAMGAQVPATTFQSMVESVE